MRTVFGIAIVAITSSLGMTDRAQASLCGASRCCLRTCALLVLPAELLHCAENRAGNGLRRAAHGRLSHRVWGSEGQGQDPRRQVQRRHGVSLLQRDRVSAPAAQQLPAGQDLRPVADCGKGTCGPGGCPELVPVQVLKKCPYTTVREVIEEQEIERPRLTCKLVKEEIIICVPHVVCKQVPVRVCCPTPCCQRCAIVAPVPCSTCGK